MELLADDALFHRHSEDEILILPLHAVATDTAYHCSTPPLVMRLLTAARTVRISLHDGRVAVEKRVEGADVTVYEILADRRGPLWFRADASGALARYL